MHQNIYEFKQRILGILQCIVITQIQTLITLERINIFQFW